MNGSAKPIEQQIDTLVEWLDYQCGRGRFTKDYLHRWAIVLLPAFRMDKHMMWSLDLGRNEIKKVRVKYW